MILTSCFSTKYLKNDEYLLYKQKIKGTEETSMDDLSSFYQQEPNRRFPLLPALYVWFHETGLKNYDEQAYKDKIDGINNNFDQKVVRAEGKVKKIGRVNRKRHKKIRKVEKTIREGNLLMRWGDPAAVSIAAVLISSMLAVASNFDAGDPSRTRMTAPSQACLSV